jgi:transcription antitermination factor NusG
MVGWLFVHAKVDDATISALLNTPGVDGIVSCAGRPLKLTLAEILLVRAAEADAEVDFDTQTREARKKLRKNAKTDPRLKMLVEKLDIAGSISMPLDSEMLAA